MSARRMRLTLTSPTGTEFDATSYLNIDQIGSVTSVPESDLAILSHSEMTLTLDNSDGEVESFFLGATPNDLYHVRLERQLPDSPEWDRVFGGVLDIPYSLSYDDMSLTARLVAYSYSKALERTPADTIKRDLEFKTASITSGTSQLVFLGTEADDLEIGDVVLLNDGQFTEQFTVVRILDSANVMVAAPASRTFTSEFAVVTTQFFHDKSPLELLTAIAAASGSVLYDRNIGVPIADFPIATPLSIANLNIGDTPISLTVEGGELVASFYSPLGGGPSGLLRKTLEGPTAVWADGATSNKAQIDWTPYTDTEPGTVIDHPGTASDTGPFAGDYVNGSYWSLTLQGSAPNYSLHLFKDGADVSGSVSNTSAAYGPFAAGSWSHDYDQDYDGVFLSYNDHAGTRAIKYFSVFGSVLTVVDSTRSGSIRAIRYNTGTLQILVDDVTGDLEIWDMLNVTMRRRIERDPNDIIITKTIRTWGNGGTDASGFVNKLWMTFLFERNNSTWIAIYDAYGSYLRWSLVAEYRVSSSVSDSKGTGGFRQKSERRAYQTVLDPDGENPIVVGFAGGEWFVLSTSYAGVIRYANFKDSSCAKAARDIAIVIGAVVDFDHFQTMVIRNRSDIAGEAVSADIGTPLSSDRLPISDLYRSSVVVSGTDSGGGSISEVQGLGGTTGDSARRLSISSDLITTPGMALACAVLTLHFAMQIREQRDVTIIDDGTPLHVFGRVKMDGRVWLVYKIHTDLEQNTHDLTLLELKP